MNNRRPTTFNPCVANTNFTRRPTDENTQQQQYNSYKSSTKQYDPFQSREILRDVTNSTTSNGTSQRNVMMQQGSQQQPLKPNTGNTFNSQNNIPKKPSSANNQQQQYKNIVQPNNNTTTYHGQLPLNVPATTHNNQYSQQPITLQQHQTQYNSTSSMRGFLPQHSSISNLSNGKVGAKVDIHTTRQKTAQQLREEELFAPGLNEIYSTETTQYINQVSRNQNNNQRSTLPPMAAARPQVNQSMNSKSRQPLTNNVKNASGFQPSKRGTHQFDAVRYIEQSIEDEHEDEEMAYSEDEELTENNTVPIVPSIGVGYPVTTSSAVASGYIAPTSVFANPTSTTSISQSSSYFSHQSSCTFIPEDPSTSSFDSGSDSDEPPKEPTNLLPPMQPLYYFREHNSGTSTINTSNCNILMPPPTTPDDSRSMRSVIFVTDVEADVLTSMRVSQMKNKPNPRYMETIQTDISGNMRCILVDWMNEVASMYTLVPETLYMAVNILDRALSKFPVRRNKLQAVGVASLFISSKFCEVDPPGLSEFIYIADDTYGKEEVLVIERKILNDLEFELVTVQPYDFIEKFLEICGVVNNPIVKYLTYYICEMQLQNYEVIGYPPSVVAASALMISLYLIDFNYWNPELARCFGFSDQACQGNSSLTSEDEQLVVIVNECLSSMFRLYVGMATGRINLSAVRTKYCHMVFQGVGECTRKIDKEPPFIPSVRSNTSSTSSAPNY